MSTEPQKTQSGQGWMKRGVSLSWPLVIALLCLGYAGYDLWDAGHTFKDDFKAQLKNVDTSTRVGRMNVMIRRQVGSLQGVDTTGLAGSYGNFLNNYNCPFVVVCEPVDTGMDYPTIAERMSHLADPPPQRSYLGGIWHSVSASPRAIWYTCGQIAKAGYWAITMFISCTILWFAVLIVVARGNTPAPALPMLLGSPAGIGMMVIFAQWLSVGAINLLGLAGCAVAVAVMAVIHGTALVVVVGGYHLSKGPREVAEGVAKIREI